MKQKKSSNERAIFKKTGEELQQYLMFKRHGTYVKNKKVKVLIDEKSQAYLKFDFFKNF